MSNRLVSIRYITEDVRICEYPSVAAGYYTYMRERKIDAIGGVLWRGDYIYTPSKPGHHEQHIPVDW